MSTIPTPESLPRRTCRVDGCAHVVAPLDRVVTGSVHPSGDGYELSVSFGWNHGFCAEHFAKIPRAFVEKWRMCKGQHALERAWQMIADDFAIEERER